VVEHEPTPEANAFEFEPGLFIPLTRAGKEDLPNTAFQPRVLDTTGYRLIANKFVTANYDV